MEYSGFWHRFGAFIIDCIISGIISIVLTMVGVNTYATGILIGFLYEPFFHSSRLQATPGKALLGMRVTTLQGGRITFKTAFVRYVVKFISGIILCVGYFMALFTEKKQTLHDMAAETLVVNGDIKGLNMVEAWYQQVLSVLGMVDKVPAEGVSNASASAYTTSTAPTGPATSQATPADLAGLYDLYQKGILTEAEYNEKRAELLKKL